jgi:formylglycine-generating enzyme required for sulfatase activity
LTGRHFSLPTEAQWEYAARGGALASPTRFAGSNNIDSVAWYADNSDGKTHPVATKAPNALGIYDMTGNVHEWCYDWFGNYPNMSQTDPKGEEFGSTKILRGGSAFREERVARVSVRNGSNPIDEGKGSGLRIVMRP